MRQTYRTTGVPRMLIFGLCGLAMMFVGLAPVEAQSFDAAKQARASLFIDQKASGQVGETVSVPVTLTANGTQPATIGFWITYDPAKVDFVQWHTGADAGGADIQHGEPEAGAVSFVATNYDQVLNDGELLTVDFLILDAGYEEVIPLGGSEASAADPQANPIGIDVFPGWITGNCIGPVAPENVVASEGSASGVLVTWGIASQAVAYQVYRALVNDTNAASPVSDWLSGVTSFTDMTALAPVTTGGGCAGPRETQTTTYYYWVRARNADGCPGPFSVPDTGYRGEAKALGGKALPAAESVPSLPLNEELVSANRDASLALRLRAGDAIDPDSVWVEVSPDGADCAQAEWVAAGQDGADGWVVCRAADLREVGTVVSMTAGGKTRSGEVVGPVSADFYIVSTTTPGSEQVAETGEAVVMVSDVAGAPDGVGAVFEIGPQGVFGAPVWAWIPACGDANAVLRCYQGNYGWLPVGDVAGLLAEAELVEETIDGQAWVGLQVRHGALVQWGQATPAVTDLDASVVSAGGAGGDVMAFLVVLAALAAWGRARRAHI